MTVAGASALLQAPSIRRTGLPREVDRLFHRADYVQTISEIVCAPWPKADESSAIQNVLLWGMAGSGKTVLATEAARGATADVSISRFYLNLHGFSETDAPLQPAEALDILLFQAGVGPTTIPFAVHDKAALWRELLLHKKSVVVLDNVHNTTQIDALFVTSPNTRFILTSRSRLPALAPIVRVRVGILTMEQGRAFFASHFASLPAEGANLEALDQCVRLCGFLPMMLRVVGLLWAHRAKSFTEIAHWLANSSDDEWIFRNADSDAGGAFEVSFGALSAEAQTALATASVLPGPTFSAERLGRVLSAPTAPYNTLFELVDVSLVTEEAGDQFKIHDLLRRYCRLRLNRTSPDRLTEIERAGLRYYSDKTAGLIDEVERGARKAIDARSWFASEYNNITATLNSDRLAGDPQILEACEQYSPRCLGLGLNSMAYQIALLAIKYAGARHDPVRLRSGYLLAAAALMAMGEFARAEELYTKALDLAEQRGPEWQAISIEFSFCLERLGEYQRGLDLLESAEHASNPSPAHQATISNNRGAIYWRLKRYSEALAEFASARSFEEEEPAIKKTGRVDNNVGFTYYKMGQLKLARRHLVASYKFDKRRGNINAMLVSLVNLGYVHALGRKPEVGTRCATRALQLALEVENQFQAARAHDALADALEACGKWAAALNHWHISRVIFEACRAPEAREVAQKMLYNGGHDG